MIDIIDIEYVSQLNFGQTFDHFGRKCDQSAARLIIIHETHNFAVDIEVAS